MLEILGFFFGVLGLIFAFETPRRKFVSFFKICAPAPKSSSASGVKSFRRKHSVIQPTDGIYGATQSGRTPYFISEPLFSLEEARAVSRETRKPLFLVIYDEEHPTRSQLDYALGCFLEWFVTKRLVEQHFVSAIVPVSAPGARALVPEDEPLETAFWVVFGPNGEILRQERLYENASEGWKRVRGVIAQLGASYQAGSFSSR